MPECLGTHNNVIVLFSEISVECRFMIWFIKSGRVFECLSAICCIELSESEIMMIFCGLMF